MRAAPAVQITIRSFGVCRVALGALVVSALILLATWLWQRGDDRSLRDWMLGAAGLIAIAGACTTWPRAPVALRWDTQDWWLGDSEASGETAQRGRIEVCLDLSNWMLLRFISTAPGPGRKPVWVPVQRRGLEAHWHALRCAVHACAASAESGRTATGMDR